MSKLKYTPETLKIGIEKYFNQIEDVNKKRRILDSRIKPHTLNSLCVYLDICPDTWCEYAKKNEYAETIKKAKRRVESLVEEGMLSGELATIGCIFSLKNNFGWVDKIDIAATLSPEKLSPHEISEAIARKKVVDHKVRILPNP